MMLLPLAMPTLAATLTVDGAGGATYTSIADAIADAASGDTIEVAAGNYWDCIDPGGKDLAIVGVDGSAATELNVGGFCESAVTIDGGETVTLQGFTVINAGFDGLFVEGSTLVASDLQLEGAGGASTEVWIAEGSDATFEDCVFNLSGSIRVRSGSVASFTNCEMTESGIGATGEAGAEVEVSLSGCTTVGSGRALGASFATITSRDTRWAEHDGVNGLAVYLSEEASFTSVGDTFEDNRDGDPTVTGGAIYAARGCHVTVEDGAFVNNRAGKAGAIYSYAGTVTLTRCTFTDNTCSDYSGGAIYAEESTVTIADSTFEGSFASDDGGAIYMEGGELTITGSLFEDNATTYGTGAGIYLVDGDAVSITGSTFRGNLANNGGGGGMLTADVVSVDGCTFEGNESGNGSAGGLGIDRPGTVSVTGSTFADNLAEGGYGGGLYLYYASGGSTLRDVSFTGNETTYYDGGGLYVYGTSLTLSDASFEGNVAGANGGGLASRTTITATDVVFRDNVAAEDGGGLHVDRAGDFSASRLWLIDNAAGSGAGGEGGGLYLAGSDAATVQNARVCGNSAHDGGGAYTSGMATLEWTNSVFQENAAADAGGGLYVDDHASWTFTNNTVVGNDAGGSGGGLYFTETSGYVTNTIVAHTAAGDGMHASDAYSGAYVRVSYSDFYANASADTAGTFTFSTASFGNTTADPVFATYSLDGDCDNDSLWLSAGSTLIDAGSSAYTDTDGTRSDIGAYGGSGAAWGDADGDEWPADVDCDDTRADAWPGAWEVWYDGVDQDCGGGSDHDQDADGHDAASGGGADCDDLEAAVHPGAVDAPGDGVDQDCDGVDAGDETDTDTDTDADTDTDTDSDTDTDTDTDADTDSDTDTDTDSDTDADTDAGADTDTGGGSKSDDGGCGCATPASPAGVGSLVGVALVAVLRRRRRA